jgi:uncharacterized membrane protein YbhN (UPF0104 family)
VRRWVLLGAAAVVLAVLWARVGWRDLVATVAGLDLGWFAAALALFLPQTLLTSARWSLLVSLRQPMSLRRSTALVLAASSMNVLLPSKMGDVAKGAFLRRDLPGGDLSSGLALGVFEKALDTAALAAWMLAACALAPPTEALGVGIAAAGAAGLALFLALLSRPVASRAGALASSARGGPLGAVVRLLGRTGEAVLLLRARPGRLALVSAMAIALWGLHLLQFSLVHRAAGGAAPEAVLWRAVPMAIFVGLLPVTFAGIGTRDAAMAYFLGASAGKGVALALGAFATVRYLVPALLGLPFLASLRAERGAPTPPPEGRGPR